MLGLLIVVGLPAGLVVYAGWPLPRHWPTTAQWEAVVGQPLTVPVFITGVVCLLWLIWAATCIILLAGIARRAVGRLRRVVRAPSLPTPMQATATGLLGVTVLNPMLPSPPHQPAGPVAPTGPVPTATYPANTSTAGDPTGGPHGPVDVPAPAGSATDPVPGSPQRTGWADGVSLPGGQWISPALAALIAAAATSVWHRRHHAYRPQLPSLPTRIDPDLTPLPDTANLVTHLLQPDVDTPTASDPTTAPPSPAGTVLPAGGVGLTGPGAAPAARAILAAAALTTLSASDRDTADTTAPGSVVTAHAWATLFPDHRPAAAPRTIRTVGDLPSALGVAETTAVARTAAGPGSDPGVFLLVCSAIELQPGNAPILRPLARPGQLSQRLAVLARVGADLAMPVVVLGDWGPDRTWTINDTGHLDAPGQSIADSGTTAPDRLSVLDTAAAVELLQLDHHNTAVTATAAQPPPNSDGEPDTTTPALVPPRGAPLTLRLLGPVQVSTAEGTELRFPRSAALPALALLALHPGGVTTADLSKTLWPHLPPHTTAHQVHTLMSTLRQVLGPAAQEQPVITRSHGRYLLNPDAIDVDLWRLHQAATIAATSDGPHRAAALQTVATLGVDAVLADGWGWPWLDRPREATSRTVRDAVSALSASHHLGRPAASAQP